MYPFSQLAHFLILLLIPTSHTLLLHRSYGTTSPIVSKEASVYHPLTGCQFRAATTSKYIYLSESSTPDFLFSVKTPWLLYYSSDVRQALRRDGFQLHKAPPENDHVAVCGWKYIGDVSAQGVPRGSITYKDAMANETELYQPPSSLTVGRIEVILFTIYPTMEITYVLFFTGLLVGSTGCVAWWYFVTKREKKQEAEDSKKEGELGGVELVTMEQKHGDEAQQPPQYRWAVTYPDTRPPLPRYESQADDLSSLWFGNSGNSSSKPDRANFPSKVFDTGSI